MLFSGSRASGHRPAAGTLLRPAILTLSRNGPGEITRDLLQRDFWTAAKFRAWSLFCKCWYVFRALSTAQFDHSRCGALTSLLRGLRPRRLNESGDGGYGFGGWRLEGELLCEESNAVAGGFGVERVRRVVDLELLRFTEE